MSKGLYIRQLKEGTVYTDVLSGQPVLVQQVVQRAEWASARGKRTNPVTGVDELVEIENLQLVDFDLGLIQRKAAKWDELHAEVAEYYSKRWDGPGDLGDIGEKCARMLGYL